MKKIIIEISDGKYNSLLRCRETGMELGVLETAILDGTVIPDEPDEPDKTEWVVGEVKDEEEAKRLAEMSSISTLSGEEIFETAQKISEKHKRILKREGYAGIQKRLNKRFENLKRIELLQKCGFIYKKLGKNIYLCRVYAKQKDHPVLYHVVIPFRIVT